MNLGLFLCNQGIDRSSDRACSGPLTILFRALGHPKLGGTASLQHILDLLMQNKEPFNNNEWRREPWPARLYAVLPDYEV